MGRPLRPSADGLIYHAINCGNNRDAVSAQTEIHNPFWIPQPLSQ